MYGGVDRLIHTSVDESSGGRKMVVPLEPYVMLWSIPQNGNVEVTELHVIRSETVRYGEEDPLTHK